MRVSVRGLGPGGVSAVTLSTGGSDGPTTLSALHARIAALSGIPAAQQLLFAGGRTLSAAADGGRALERCLGGGDNSAREVHLVRNIHTRNYPSARLRFAVWRSRAGKYCGGALAALSAFSVIWQTLWGTSSLRRALPLSDGILSPFASGMAVPLIVCVCGGLATLVHLGHWVAGFPILPAALFTLVHKGAQQNEAAAAAASTASSGVAGTLDRMEMRLAEIIVRYVPNLVHESANLIGASHKGVMQLHRQYGGTRLRLVCADGVAIDGMHVCPDGGKDGGSSSATKKPGSDRKCYIVVNGNAEFYELDGLQHRAHSNSARYTAEGFDVLLFNYRGVGVSEGYPTRDGLLLDLHALVDFATRPLPYGLGIPPARVVVCGRSLGGAISTILLGNEMCAQPFVLCNTRSFAQLSATANLLLSQQYGARVGPLASKGIGILGWELDALAAWRKCKGFKWYETVADDDIILAGGKLSDGIERIKATGRTATGSGAALVESDLRRVELATSTGASSHNRMLYANEYRMRHVMLTEAMEESRRMSAGVETKKAQ